MFAVVKKEREAEGMLGSGEENNSNGMSVWWVEASRVLGLKVIGVGK